MNRGPSDANQPIGPDANGPTNGDVPGGIPDHLIDSILDGDMPREKVRRALDQLRRDQRQSSDLDWTADALNALRADALAPDMSEIILARTGMERSWLSAVMRRKMVIGRVTGVAAVLAMIAGAFMIQRVSPETFDSAPTPVRELANAVPSDAAHAASIMRTPVAYTVTAPPSPTTESEAYFLMDDPAPGDWRDNLLAGGSLRELWTSRSQPLQATPGITPVGFSPDAFTLIAPIAPAEDRGSSAAITAGRR